MNKQRPFSLQKIRTAFMALVVLGTLGTNLCQAEAKTPPEPDVPAGYMLVEGDILVPSGPRAVFRTDNFWPSGVVPYEFDANAQPCTLLPGAGCTPACTADNQGAMRAAMDAWEAVANVTFVPRANEVNFLHIQNSCSNSSAVGMQSGQQLINIFNWNNTFVMAHELAHALGMWHEQTRSDRGCYVQINDGNNGTTDNICPGMGGNFTIAAPQELYGPYDFDSVMHYGQCAFSQCNMAPGTCNRVNNTCAATGAACWTIQVLAPNQGQQTAIGQRNSLSKFDALTMSFLYPKPSWRFLDQGLTCDQQNCEVTTPGCWANSDDGTFLAPFETFSQAESMVSPGTILWIQPGVYSAPGTHTKPMTLRAPLGGVTLGG